MKQSSKPSGPSRFALTLLRWLWVPDYIIGDFVEEYERVTRQHGRIKAHIWFWLQLIRSAPAFCLRRWQMMMKTLTKKDKHVLFVSTLMLVPALLLGIPGLLHSVFELSGPMNAVYRIVENSVWLSWLLHPTAVLGGLAMALLLAAWRVVRVEVRNQPDQLAGTLSIRKGYWLHLAVLGTAVLFALLIFAYLLVENLQIFRSF